MIECGPFFISPKGETILIENENSPAAQRNATAEVELFDIHGPEEVFLCGSMGEITPVRKFDVAILKRFLHSHHFQPKL